MQIHNELKSGKHLGLRGHEGTFASCCVKLEEKRVSIVNSAECKPAVGWFQQSEPARFESCVGAARVRAPSLGRLGSSTTQPNNPRRYAPKAWPSDNTFSPTKPNPISIPRIKHYAIPNRRRRGAGRRQYVSSLSCMTAINSRNFKKIAVDPFFRTPSGVSILALKV